MIRGQVVTEPVTGHSVEHLRVADEVLTAQSEVPREIVRILRDSVANGTDKIGGSIP